METEFKRTVYLPTVRGVPLINEETLMNALKHNLYFFKPGAKPFEITVFAVAKPATIGEIT